MVKKRGTKVRSSFCQAVPHKAVIIILLVVIVVGFVTIGLSIHDSDNLDLAASYGLAAQQSGGELGIRLIPPPDEEVLEP